MERKNSKGKNEELKFNEYTIIDNKELNHKQKNNYVLTENGQIIREVSYNKKCHCSSSKKYKNCCFDTDLTGYYEEDNKTFYCDLMIFFQKFQDKLDFKKIEENKNSNDNSYGNSETHLINKFDRIYI